MGRGLKTKKYVDPLPGSSERLLTIAMSGTMTMNVMVEPFMATGAAQWQGNILAEKAPCFYGSAAIVCVGYLVVQRACTTQQFCGLESGGAAILVLLRFEGAPSTFTSAQPMNSKYYDPFFRGICHASQVIRRFVDLRDANARGLLLDS